MYLVIYLRDICIYVFWFWFLLFHPRGLHMLCQDFLPREALVRCAPYGEILESVKISLCYATLLRDMTMQSSLHTEVNDHKNKYLCKMRKWMEQNK